MNKRVYVVPVLFGVLCFASLYHTVSWDCTTFSQDTIDQISYETAKHNCEGIRLIFGALSAGFGFVAVLFVILKTREIRQRREKKRPR